MGKTLHQINSDLIQLPLALQLRSCYASNVHDKEGNLDCSAGVGKYNGVKVPIMLNLNFCARKILQENNSLGYYKSKFTSTKTKQLYKTLFELNSFCLTKVMF